jgi:biopolymer transport protein ExbD
MRSRRPVPSFAAESQVPMSELNTTPLIDVMLVLLIMFIITIPISTHKVPMDLPSGEVTKREPAVHRLDLDSAGRIFLDGAQVTQQQLPALLAPIRDDPGSELHLRADPETPYDSFDHVLAATKRAGVTQLGLVDNERFVPAIR